MLTLCPAGQYFAQATKLGGSQPEVGADGVFIKY